MHHPGGVTSSVLEAVELLLAHVPRAGYVVGETGRIHAVNALAARCPQEVDPQVQRALIEAMKPASGQVGYQLVAALGSPPSLFVLLDVRASNPLERALPAIAKRFGLTKAETDVLRLWVRGRTQAQIAAERGTSAGTVHIQLQHVRSKLGVSRRREIEAFLRSQVGL